MKKMISAVTSFFLLMYGSSVMAETVYGKVIFLGTLNERAESGEYEAQLRVRISGTCDDSNTQNDSRWFAIRSGRMESPYFHNSVNFRNIYSTLLAAQLANKTVQIDGFSYVVGNSKEGRIIAIR